MENHKRRTHLGHALLSIVCSMYFLACRPQFFVPSNFEKSFHTIPYEHVLYIVLNFLKMNTIFACIEIWGPHPLHCYDFCLLKVEFKMNNFQSNLGGAPAKKMAREVFCRFRTVNFWNWFFYVPLMTHPGVNQQSTSLEHLLMLFFEQNLFILNANRAGLGSHSKWTNFGQKTTRVPTSWPF